MREEGLLGDGDGDARAGAVVLHGIVDGVEIGGALLGDALGGIVDEVSLIGTQTHVHFVARVARAFALVGRVV